MLANKKDSILKKIRAALAQPTPMPFPNSNSQTSVYLSLSEEIEVAFAERFTALQGKFAFCFDQKHLVEQFDQLTKASNWKRIYCTDSRISSLFGQEAVFLTQFEDLADCDAAITGCEYLVARTGSIVLSAADPSGRNASVYAPVHVCIAYTSQLVYDVKDALEDVKEKYNAQLPSLITFATGPSRTADIEKTLVVGVHGPKEVYVFLIDDKE